MKNAINRKSRLMSLILVVLIAAMVLSLAACGGKDEGAASAQKKSFTLEVVDPDGKTESFEIETTETTVGGALIAEGLVEGEDGPYGLYVKTVNGVTLDYDTHGMYWAFYVNGDYGMSGCEKTDIEDGATYAFKAEK